MPQPPVRLSRGLLVSNSPSIFYVIYLCIIVLWYLIYGFWCNMINGDPPGGGPWDGVVGVVINVYSVPVSHVKWGREFTVVV